MPLNRVAELFLNTQRTPGNILRRSVDDATPPDTPLWIEDDKFLIRLRFVRPLADTVAGGEIVRLDLTETIILGGKRRRGTGPLLFSAHSFVETIVRDEPTQGEGEGAITDVYYTATLNLRTQVLRDAFGGDESIQVYVDVEVKAPDSDPDDDQPGDDGLTWQFQANIARQAYAGEVAPVPALPPYPSPDNLIPIVPPDVGNFRFRPGASGILFQIKGRITGAFYAPWVEGDAGAETLSFDPADYDAVVPGPNDYALRAGANYRVIDTASFGTLLQIRHRVDEARFYTLTIDGEAGAETLAPIPASATA
ncbi:hypothetical protein [Geminisphaera colitermitum]|uniref:hypothetical protein n=1 Tax=Geminisphaera colitermitum TaxID=1148786 RepID=UPI000158C60B|nr:hypothetical protein [Geminisphaera colitermitum]